MCETERQAFFHFWREVGRRMNIKEIPEDYTSFEAFNRAYEREQFRYSKSNHRVGEATRELFVSWFPRPLSPLVRATIHAMLDDPLIEAFGFPKPSRLMRAFVRNGLRLRGMLSGLLPARRRPRLRTEMRHPSYPSGYTIEALGPPKVAE
jgi:hypothetical protein